MLSETGNISTSNFRSLRANLRNFVRKRVNAPTKQAPSIKQIDRKLQIFKNEDFYIGLRHAVVYHNDCLIEPAKDAEEISILTLIQQLSCVRSVMEKIVTLGSTSSLEALYGNSIFKCPEPRCESFFEGFTTAPLRDRHFERHERMYLCSFLGCPSSMIGFSSSTALQKHEQDYHSGDSPGISFPWHGDLKKIDISEEVKKGNYLAFELWLSQITDSRNLPLKLMALHGQNRMLEASLKTIGSDKPRRDLFIRDAIMKAIRVGNMDGVRILLDHFNDLETIDIAILIIKTLRVGMDNITKELLKLPSSPVKKKANAKKKAQYLSLAIQYGRFAIVQLMLETYGAGPNKSDKSDEAARTSLLAAAEFDRIEIANHLIEKVGCDKFAGNKHGLTPLSVAGRQGHEEFISSIYRDEMSTRGVQIWLRTAQLRNAARDGDDTHVRQLLNEGLAKKDEMDTQLRSPWLWAVERNHDRVVEVFLTQTDVNFHRRLQIKGNSKTNLYPAPGVLHLVALSGNDCMMRALLQSRKFDDEVTRSCRGFGKVGTRRRNFSGTPLEVAKKCNNQDTATVLDDYIATLDNKETRQSTLTAENQGSPALQANSHSLRLSSDETHDYSSNNEEIYDRFPALDGEGLLSD